MVKSPSGDFGVKIHAFPFIYRLRTHPYTPPKRGNETPLQGGVGVDLLRFKVNLSYSFYHSMNSRHSHELKVTASYRIKNDYIISFTFYDFFFYIIVSKKWRMLEVPE